MLPGRGARAWIFHQTHRATAISKLLVCAGHLWPAGSGPCCLDNSSFLPNHNCIIAILSIFNINYTVGDKGSSFSKRNGGFFLHLWWQANKRFQSNNSNIMPGLGFHKLQSLCYHRLWKKRTVHSCSIIIRNNPLTKKKIASWMNSDESLLTTSLIWEHANSSQIT